jgi:hypothetical protein
MSTPAVSDLVGLLARLTFDDSARTPAFLFGFGRGGCAWRLPLR